MANEKDPEEGTRGWRVDQMRQKLGLSRADFATALRRVAADLDLDAGGKWTATRMTNTILGKKPIPLDDAAVLVAFAARNQVKEFTWNYLTFGQSGIPKERVQQNEPRETAVHRNTKGRAAVGGR